MKKFIWISFIVIVAVVIGVVIDQVNSGSNSELTSIINPTAKVRESDFVMTSFGIGYLEGTSTETVYFPQTGVVKDIPVELGDLVQINDIVAILENEETQLLLQKAIINLDKLTSSKIVSQTEIKILQAQEILDSAEKNLEIVIAGPVIEYYDEQLESATETYYSTLSKLNSLKNPPARIYDALENSRLAMEEAQLDLEIALAYVVPLEDIQRAQAEVNVAAANLDVERALLAYLSGSQIEGQKEFPVSKELIEIKEAEWQVLEAQQSLANTILTSPIEGFVTSINTVVGESVSSNTPIITITNPDVTELRFYLDESDLGGLSIGDTVLVSFQAYPDTVFNARVSNIDFSIVKVDGENKIQAKAIFDEPLNILLPIGSEADIEVITVEEKNVLTIPYQALIKDGSGNYQVIVLSDGQAEYRTITIGMSDFANIIVESGLVSGEIVSTNPSSYGEEE